MSLSSPFTTSFEAKITSASNPSSTHQATTSQSKVLKSDSLDFSFASSSDGGGVTLGAGGFGVVRKAMFRGRVVAVKSLKMDNSDGSINQLKAIELFASEATKMSQISHPRVVEFIGFVLESFSIIMECMSEGTLADFLKRNLETVIPWSTRYWFAADIAEGMAYLHSKKDVNGKPKIELFHQDLKPANVLLNLEDGVLRGKISDLGLAAIKTSVSESSGQKKPNKLPSTNLTSFVAHQGGTFAYMAPELIKGSLKVKLMKSVRKDVDKYNLQRYNLIVYKSL